MAVRPDGAAVERAVLRVRERRRHLVVLPCDAAVGGRRHHRLEREVVPPAEAVVVDVADVDVAEEPARRRVVGPDLLLVDSRGGRDVRRCEVRLRPVALDLDSCWRRIVDVGNGDGEGAVLGVRTLRDHVVGQARREAGGVQPLPVRPREPVRTGSRAERDAGIAA